MRKSYKIRFFADFRTLQADQTARAATRPATQPAQPAARGARGAGGGGGQEIRFLVPTDYSPRK